MAAAASSGSSSSGSSSSSVDGLSPLGGDSAADTDLSAPGAVAGRAGAIRINIRSMCV